jgi:hypothetical protein
MILIMRLIKLLTDHQALNYLIKQTEVKQDQ